MKLWHLNMVNNEHNEKYMDGCHNYADGHYEIARDEAEARALLVDDITPNVWDNPENSTCEKVDMRKARYLTCDYDVH